MTTLPDRCHSKHRVKWWMPTRLRCRSFIGHMGLHWAGEWLPGKSPKYEW